MPIQKTYGAICDNCSAGIDYYHKANKQTFIDFLIAVGTPHIKRKYFFCNEECKKEFKEKNNIK